MKRSLLIGFILITCLLICGCISNTVNTSKDTLQSDKYVAVLEYYVNESTLIGNTTYTPVPPMPIPTPVPIFDYNNSRGFIGGDLNHFGVDVNDSFKILLGKISYIDSPTTVGYMGTTLDGKHTSPYELMGVYSLPYTIEGKFTVLSIAQNGTILSVCDNRTIYLKPGENYTFILYSANTTGSYLANPQNKSVSDFFMNPTQMPWPINNKVSVTITNEGIFSKSTLNG